MYPSFCSDCGKFLWGPIPAYNLDNYYSDFYEAGIGFEVICEHCGACYSIIPENQEKAIELHKKFNPYNKKTG